MPDVSDLLHNQELNLMYMCSYLDERMPVCDGFAWVSQHFIPVFSSQTLSIITYSTHADDLIVTYTVKKDSKILCLLCKTTS